MTLLGASSADGVMEMEGEGPRRLPLQITTCTQILSESLILGDPERPTAQPD